MSTVCGMGHLSYSATPSDGRWDVVGLGSALTGIYSLAGTNLLGPPCVGRAPPADVPVELDHHVAGSSRWNSGLDYGLASPGMDVVE